MTMYNDEEPLAQHARVPDDAKDAARYRWLRARKGLQLTTDGSKWTRADGTSFVASHRLCAEGVSFAPHESLDAAIDAAMQKGGAA